MNKIKTILLLLVFMTNTALTAESAGIIRKPIAGDNSIVFTDNRESALYTIRDGDIQVLAEGRGIGYHINISPISGKIGSKLILDNGLQVPVLIYSDGDKMDYLHQPVHQAGQVSFTDKGIAAWTIGSFLHLSDGRSVQLPAYANIAPVSPCGDYVVSNDREDQLWLTHINTGEQKRISPVLKPGFFNPEWSPGGNHILFSSLAGVLYVYSLENGTTKELTDVYF